jgi:hypothetical protein
MTETVLQGESGRPLRPPRWHSGDDVSRFLLAKCFYTWRRSVLLAEMALLHGEIDSVREYRAVATEASQLLAGHFEAWAPSGAEIRRPN